MRRELAVVALLASVAEADVKTHIEEIRQAVAKTEELDPAGVEITVLDHADVPGLVVFRAKLTAARARRAGAFVGVYGAGKALTDSDEAMQAVINAWHYGARRTVPAERVAAVLGFLEGVREPAHPILTAADLSAVANPEWRGKVALPREVTVQGKPGVEYFNRSGQPPLWRTVAVVDGHGTLELSITPINRLP